jgi:hypothetical protein
VAAVDLTHPDAKDVSIPLTPRGSGATVMPQKPVFKVRPGEDGEELAAYFLASGSDDLYEVTFTASGGGKGEARVSASINQFATGASPAALAVFDGEDGKTKAATVNAGAWSLSVVDVATAVSFTVQMGSQVGAMETFKMKRHDSDKAENAALVHSGGGQAQNLFHVVWLDRVAELKSKAVDTTYVPNAFTSVTRVPGGNVFMVRHDGYDSGVSFVDVESGDVALVKGLGVIEDMEFSPSGDLALFLVQREGGTYLIRVGIADLHPEAAEVKADASRMLYAPEQGRVLLDHDGPTGMASLFDQDDVADDAEEILYGFLVRQVFEW